MFEDILAKRSLYDKNLFTKMRELERAKLVNEQVKHFSVLKDRLTSLALKVEKHRMDLTKLRAAVIKEDNDFKNRRIEYLNAVITEALADIFPEEGVTAELLCDFSRTDVVELILYDCLGHEYIPDICSGKLMQYLISFSAITGITLKLGKKNIFVDEAFGVASPDIMGKIGDVVQERIDSGLQLIMIAQNSAVYQDLPRHEIILQKDPVLAETCVITECDY